MYIHFNAMRSMGKKAVSLIMMLTLGLTNAWGETETKTEGFQTASTGSYNISTIRNLNTTESDCNIGWEIYYGNIISNASAINGKSCLIRWYKNEASKFGHARTTTPIKGLTNITFKAKNTANIISMYVSYSTDGTKWTTWSNGALSSNGNDWTPFTNQVSIFLSTTPYYFSYDIPNSSPNTDYYIRIMLSKTSASSKDEDLIIDDVVFTYTKSGEATIADGETMSIDEPTEMESLTIEAGGTIGGEAELTVKDLTIKSALGSASGSGDSNGKCAEITNPHITATGDVFFELELTPDAQASYGWYAFSVPFEVSATDGVYFQDSKLALETGYTIMAYHGDIRAQGQYAWKKHSGVLQPGVLYIISVGDTDYKTLRFKKQAEAALYNDVVNGSSQMTTQEFPSAIHPDHAGWNGLGNPYLGKSHISSLDLQFLDHEANAFKLRSSDDVKMMMGSAFFYQSDGSAITVTRDDIGSIALAPARALSAMEQKTYVVRLMNEAGEEEDRLFLRAGEEDSDSYEIGRDVAKMSMGDARCAQIWVPAYGTQLCAAAFPLVNGQATYPLTFRAPAAGRYSIAMQAASEADVFLTHEGKIICNLNESPYEIELAQGTTKGYGLLLQAKMPTGVETIDNSQFTIHNCQKVIIDDHVYILRDGRMYDVTGRMK